MSLPLQTRAESIEAASAAITAEAEAVPPRASLKALAIRGAYWTVGGFAGSQIIRLGSNIVLAWLLVPEAFGLMLLVNMVMQGLQMFSDIGIGPSIIQNDRGNDQSFLNTAWTIQIVRGIVLWLCAIGLAWPMAWLFARNDPLAWQLLYLIPVTGFMAVLGGFFSTRLYTLNRQLAMGRFTLIQAGSQIAGVAVMIGWALIHPSVWALVAGGVAAFASKLVLSHTAIPGQRLSIQWDRRSAHSLFAFGKWILLSTAIAFLALQADRILLGSFVPLHVLGVYGFGLMVATLPREVLVHLTGMVLFPALSEHGRNNRETLPEKIYMARSALLPAATAILLAVVVLSPVLFTVFYPQQFHDAAWMAQLLCVGVWFTVLASTSDRALLAIGNARALAIGNIVNLAVTVPAALGGLALFGVPGFIGGYALGAVGNLLVIQVAMRFAGVSVFRQDLQYTAMAFGLMSVGAGAPHLVNGNAGFSWITHLLVAAVLLPTVGLWAAYRAWPVLRRS